MSNVTWKSSLSTLGSNKNVKLLESILNSDTSELVNFKLEEGDDDFNVLEKDKLIGIFSVKINLRCSLVAMS